MKPRNPKVRYTEKRGTIRASIDGSSFEYVISNEASRAAAIEQMYDHSERVIHAIETRAGRELSQRELYFGIKPAEDRSKQQIIADENADLKAAKPKPEETNPYRNVLESGMLDKKKQTPKQRVKELADQYDERKAAEAEAAAKPANPRQAIAVALARADLQELKHTDTSTSVVRAAEHRLRLAQSGDLTEFAAQHRQYVAEKQQALNQKLQAIDNDIENLNKERTSIATFEADIPEPVKVGPRNLFEAIAQMPNE